MNARRDLKICFMGGKQAGMIGTLTVLAWGGRMISAVSYSGDLTKVLNIFNIPMYKSVEDEGFVKDLERSDLLLCVHGREIVRPRLLDMPRLGAVNIHPYLSGYKGADPVGRALNEGDYNASVGAHIMEEKIDHGRVLVEEYVDVSGAGSVVEVYNALYPHYSTVILKVLEMIR
ncbi:MAG: hypothetical protein KAS86_03955 [Candidatus Omnitrophica bacterium]|nr:hypothetical protein [Candidatus Omnitrophota bacterium]